MKRLFPAVLTVLFAASCTEPPEYRAARVTRARVERTVSNVTSGTVKAEREAELSFGMVGRVGEVRVKLGDRVKAGQTIAALENADLGTVMKNAAVDFDRVRVFMKSKALAPGEIERSQNALDVARANYEKSLMKAPFDGLVSELNLEVGQLSQVTTPLADPLLRVVDLEPRYVVTEVDEVDLPLVKEGVRARVKILAVRREPFKGSVRKVIPYVKTRREQDRTSEIEVTVDSEGTLLPVGASADVELVIETRGGVLAVPSRTILGRSGGRFVFTVLSGKARRTPVETGIMNYDTAEILSGLREGDVVLYPSDSAETEDGAAVKAVIAGEHGSAH